MDQSIGVGAGVNGEYESPTAFVTEGNYRPHFAADIHGITVQMLQEVDHGTEL